MNEDDGSAEEKMMMMNEMMDERVVSEPLVLFSILSTQSSIQQGLLSTDGSAYV